MVMLYGTPLFFLRNHGRQLKYQKTTTSRQPSPVGCARIAIGDVGFIRRGRFYFLFSAGSSLGQRILGEDVPTTFEQLIIGPLARDQPRPPGCLCTSTVQGVGAGLGATVSTTLYVTFLWEFSA